MDVAVGYVIYVLCPDCPGLRATRRKAGLVWPLPGKISNDKRYDSIGSAPAHEARAKSGCFGPGHFRLWRLNEAGGAVDAGPMGIESTLIRRESVICQRSVDGFHRPGGTWMAPLSPEGWAGRVFGRIEGSHACRHTRAVRVPQHTVVSRLGNGYELSMRSFLSTDLCRICRAVSFPMSIMGLPQ